MREVISRDVVAVSSSQPFCIGNVRDAYCIVNKLLEAKQ